MVKNYIPTLDGWRAIAITGVLVYHGLHEVVHPEGLFPSYTGRRLVRLGAAGVDLFFALSGFLICSRLIQEQATHGSISLRAFFVRRVFRILPPAYFYLAVLAVLTLGGFLTIGPLEWVSCLTFWRNYAPVSPVSGWYTAHFWSLAIEEHFYLFWPLLMVGVGLTRARWLSAALALAVIGWALAVASMGVAEWLGDPHDRTDTRLDSLLWGCWAALILSVPAWKQRLSWVGRPAVWGGLVLLVAYFLWRGGFVAQHLVAFLAPWLLVGTVLNPDGLAGRGLEWSPLRWLGSISYSLYLWQQLFLLGSYELPRPGPLGYVQEMPLNIVAVFLCAIFSYYIVEKPMIQLGRRLLRNRKTEHPAATQPASTILAVN